VGWVAGSASVVVDPDTDPPARSREPNDDYLISLASVHRAALLSGDNDLLIFEDEIPVFSPRGFLDLLAELIHNDGVSLLRLAEPTGWPAWTASEGEDSSSSACWHEFEPLFVCGDGDLEVVEEAGEPE
jgi:hypothetical protein